MREFAIIGHGDWMFDSGLGDEIDKFDRVMRFPFYEYQRRVVSDDERSFNWGKKTTDLCVSVQTIPAMIQDGTIPERHTWMWTRPGDWNDKYITQNKMFKPIRAMAAITPWQMEFQKMGAKAVKTTHGKQPIFSRGTAAVIIVCHYIKPKELTLFGFQNVMRAYSDRYTIHDWWTERELIKKVSDFYKVKIKTDREAT